MEPVAKEWIIFENMHLESLFKISLMEAEYNCHWRGCQIPAFLP